MTCFLTQVTGTHYFIAYRWHQSGCLSWERWWWTLYSHTGWPHQHTAAAGMREKWHRQLCLQWGRLPNLDFHVLIGGNQICVKKGFVSHVQCLWLCIRSVRVNPFTNASSHWGKYCKISLIHTTFIKSGKGRHIHYYHTCSQLWLCLSIQLNK